jgi:D-3-phosphoglycerate dehydrogenase / 2-oxoglutarate reductase
MSRRKVLIAAPVHSVLTEGLAALGYECVIKERIVQGEANSLVADCTGIITSTRLQLDKDLLDAAPALRWIGRMGSGMEVIDVPYATARGIKCYSSPEGNRNAVAEHALGMLLSLNKHIVKSHYEIKEGKWLRDENRGVELNGKTIGIIGLGHTGCSFAHKLAGFDVRILAYDKYDKVNFCEPIIYCENLEQIYNEADIISFHVPLQNDTIHYFNNDFIRKMKKPFVLLNTSRGKVVDSKALLDGLHSGKVRGACLDVWEEEPLEKMNDELKNILNEILKMPNVIVTPHIAGYSFEALYKMSKTLLDKLS